MGVGERQGERETEIDKNYRREGRRQRDSKEKETEG